MGRRGFDRPHPRLEERPALGRRPAPRGGRATLVELASVGQRIRARYRPGDLPKADANAQNADDSPRLGRGMTRVGVVGAGYWGIHHVRTFASLGALAAVCDADPKVRARLVAQYPAVRVV